MFPYRGHATRAATNCRPGKALEREPAFHRSRDISSTSRCKQAERQALSALSTPARPAPASGRPVINRTSRLISLSRDTRLSTALFLPWVTWMGFGGSLTSSRASSLYQADLFTLAAPA
ncbi:hypothetical protein [Desulfobulbus oligotrophicus]|uniref:Uncharacterized protein n=1 Tax=Desulfobulbus oligotrophicus TaxID=1909699 RepID=A0A7T6AQ86_9BACT|nr:hypothetical protein [Desulfobulbus oligotrophicus]MDY0390122.1 hypothetical protein [Desulfobulbus oligotrophicus]QQG65225.1 hypothetical protein HP555_04770 [Desulfobulbus oligotrophicus]